MKSGSFEKALEKLEKTVEDLESGNFTLDEALKKYEEGIKAARSCREMLEKAKAKIEVLSKQESGEYDTELAGSDEISSEKRKR